MRKGRAVTAFSCVAAAALLLGCGKQPEAPKRRDATPAATEQSIGQAGKELIDAIKTPQLAGGSLSVAPGQFSFQLDRGGSEKSGARVRNEGDTPVTISSIETAIPSDGIAFDQDGCRAGTVLAPSQSCDISLSYKDKTGRPADNGILILSDAKKTPSVRMLMKVDIKQPPQQQEPAADQPPKQAAPRSDFQAGQIAMINQLRRNSGWGDDDASLSDPQKKVVSQEARYPEDMFNWTESSLPVDQKRIIRNDGVIRAVLESPITNIMCSNVYAVVDTDVYGAGQFPGRDEPLIPAGSRFLGRCNGYTDERAAVVWTRLTTPQGVSVRIIGAAKGPDGKGGIPGYLDRRWFDKYGIPVMFSGLRAGIQYLLTRGEDAASTVTNPELGITTSTSTPEAQAIDRFQNDTDTILQGVQQDLKTTQEVLDVPTGTRLEISLLEDIYFKDPYTVVAIGDDEYTLPDKKRQQLYRTQPKSVVASYDAGGDAAAPQDGAPTVRIGNQTFYLTPAPSGGSDGDQAGQAGGTGATRRKGTTYSSQNGAVHYPQPGEALADDDGNPVKYPAPAITVPDPKRAKMTSSTNVGAQSVGTQTQQ